MNALAVDSEVLEAGTYTNARPWECLEQCGEVFEFEAVDAAWNFLSVLRQRPRLRCLPASITCIARLLRTGEQTGSYLSTVMVGVSDFSASLGLLRRSLQVARSGSRTPIANATMSPGHTLTTHRSTARNADDAAFSRPPRREVMSA